MIFLQILSQISYLYINSVYISFVIKKLKNFITDCNTVFHYIIFVYIHMYIWHCIIISIQMNTEMSLFKYTTLKH